MAVTESAGFPQLNIAINEAISCVFFEDNNLVFNYKTNQWSRTPIYAGLSYFDYHDSDAIIGVVIFSGDSGDLSGGRANFDSAAPADALFVTGETDPNQQGRFVTTGVRTLVNESANTVVKARIGYRDTISATVNFTATATPSAVTNISPFRQDARYHRAEIEIEGGFDTALGIDVQGYPQGNR